MSEENDLVFQVVIVDCYLEDYDDEEEDELEVKRFNIYEMNQGIDVSLTCSIWDEFGIATYYHDWFPPPPTGSAIASVGFGYYSFETGSSDNTNDAPIIMMQKFLVLNNEIMTIK